jgi:hypothetical protein
VTDCATRSLTRIHSGTSPDEERITVLQCVSALFRAMRFSTTSPARCTPRSTVDPVAIHHSPPPGGDPLSSEIALWKTPEQRELLALLLSTALQLSTSGVISSRDVREAALCALCDLFQAFRPDRNSRGPAACADTDTGGRSARREARAGCGTSGKHAELNAPPTATISTTVASVEHAHTQLATLGAELFAFFLPGTLVPIAQTALGDYKQGHRLFTLAWQLLASLLTSTLGDSAYPHSAAAAACALRDADPASCANDARFESLRRMAASTSSSPGNVQACSPDSTPASSTAHSGSSPPTTPGTAACPFQVTLDRRWLDTALEHVTPLIHKLFSRVHGSESLSSWKVHLAQVQAADLLLRECAYNLCASGVWKCVG